MLFKKITPSAAYYTLNVLRVGNVISLLTVTVATWIMIIKSATTNQFYFFDAATQLLVFLWALFLIMTELTFFKFVKKWIHTSWPVFSDEHSFLWFGLMMMGLSCNVLGDLNNPTFSRDNLGGPWYSAILASGILTMTFGAFNILASIIFRDAKMKITARMYRSKGAMAGTIEQSADYYNDYNSGKMSSDGYEKEQNKGIGNKLKRMTQLFTRNKADISAPVTYPAAPNDDLEAAHRPSYDTYVEREDRRSPVAPGIERPPTRLHPAHTRPESTYSEANMSRFTEYPGKYDTSNKF